MAGCAHFEPRPLEPAQAAQSFENRSLDDPRLKEFLETNLPSRLDAWPLPVWDLKQLTLAAIYYQPSLAEARAQLLTAQAAKVTAGQRPNPTVSTTPAYDGGIPDNFSPWLVPVNIDVPIETAGKRTKRLAQAELLAEASRWDLAGEVWKVRSEVHSALLELFSARETAALLERQAAAQSNVVRLLEGQLAAGAISDFEVGQARIALGTTQLSLQDALGKSNQALASLARALGVPASALKSAKFSFPALDQFPRELTRPEVRRQALLNRADVRGALAQYAASQATLQLEIANQYPDLQLGPGYAWNNGNAGDNEWSLGLTVTLPVMNHNQGPVAEAEAKRAQAAAHFVTVQANAIADIDSALAACEAALQQVATAEKLLTGSQQHLDAIRAQEQAGELDAQAVASAEVEFGSQAQSRLDALLQAQQAFAKLEDAVQSPLTIPQSIIDAAQNLAQKHP